MRWPPGTTTSCFYVFISRGFKRDGLDWTGYDTYQTIARRNQDRLVTWRARRSDIRAVRRGLSTEVEGSSFGGHFEEVDGRRGAGGHDAVAG